MKLYISFTKMNFEEDTTEHNIIRGMSDREFLTYDEMVELPDDDQFIKDIVRVVYKKDKEGKDTKEVEGKIFLIKEQDFEGLPLYEFKDGEIIPFDHTKYAYFAGTRRRGMLKKRISEIYNPPSEVKTMRKTLKYIMDELNIDYPDFFEKYNNKIEEIINKNPKGVSNGRIS